MSAAGDGPGAPRPRPAAARFHSRAGGIEAVEAFSRGDAFDREWMGWGALRVLSRQDWAPAAVRDEGRVANMERLLLVLDGALDADCGDLGRVRVDAGGALWIGAGHGLAVRLANASISARLRLVELWMRPEHVNAVPAVAVPVPAADPGDAAAGAGAAWAALPLHRRARVSRARLAPGQALDLPRSDGAHCWLEVLDGEVAADPPGLRLGPGDGIAWRTGDADVPVTLANPRGAGHADVLLLALPA